MNMIVKNGEVKLVSNEYIAAEVRLAAAAAAAPVVNVGDVMTCQFGNPGDSDWSEATHANVEVKVIWKQECKITKRMYYLVVKMSDPEYVGRAGDVRGRQGCEDIKGDLYCTSARTFDSKAQKWTGITTFLSAANSLGFDISVS